MKIGHTTISKVKITWVTRPLVGLVGGLLNGSKFSSKLQYIFK